MFRAKHSAVTQTHLFYFILYEFLQRKYARVHTHIHTQRTHTHACRVALCLLIGKAVSYLSGLSMKHGGADINTAVQDECLLPSVLQVSFCF